MTKNRDLNAIAEDVANQLRELVATLKNLMILQLGLEGVQKQAIRRAVGVNLNRVTKILRNVKPRGANSEQNSQPTKHRGKARKPRGK